LQDNQALNWEHSKMKKRHLLKNEKGSVLVISMLILVLLTLIGKAAVTTSTIETEIAGNERFHKRTFYATEAGLGHAMASLQKQFGDNNNAMLAAGQPGNWDFALIGATNTNFAGGVQLINSRALGDGAALACNYSVRVWNNPGDPGGNNSDTDQLLDVQVDATGPKGSANAILVRLQGLANGEAINGYGAQEGGGSGKNYNSSDANAIVSF
jgi:type IV pilus assembly protein PilX